MEEDLREYISNLNVNDIPWNRMITAYGNAGNYPEALSILEHTKDIEEFKKAWYIISDFEHQSTMFQPAPFALVFLVKLFKKCLVSNSPVEEQKAILLLDKFTYFAEVCFDIESWDHAEPLDSLSELLDDCRLLPTQYDEADLDAIFENAFPDDQFYSHYYYSRQVLSQVPAILKRSGKLMDEAIKMESLF